MDKRSRSRSRNRSPPAKDTQKLSSYQSRRTKGGGFSDKPKPSGFTSGFSNTAPTHVPQQMTTAEILDYYKQYNPNQNLTNHNKAERQLYVGNIPLDMSSDQLIEVLNKALQELGKENDIFQNGNPIVGTWISGDGHYAFVDFRTADEATQGFVLQQVAIKGNYLKVGRPKNATGIIPTPQQLLCGDPNFNPSNPSASVKQKATTSSLLVQQALKQSRAVENQKQIKYNQRLIINNFPLEQSEKVIFDLCNIYGNVTTVEMIQSNGQFNGSCNIDFESEFEAKKAFSSMMGLQVGNKYLYVKKCQPPTEEEMAENLASNPAECGEIFLQIIEDKPTNCLVLKNLVSLQENHEPEDFKELEFDVLDEMVKYGSVIRTHVPRPPKYGGDPQIQQGLGKVYVRFEGQKDAENAKKALIKRRFNDRLVEPSFYPEDKFINNVFE